MPSCLCGALSVNRQRVSGDRIIDYDSFHQMTLPWTFSKESRTTTYTSTHVSSDSINEDVLDTISPRLSHCCLLRFDPPCFSPHIHIRHYLRSQIRTTITSGALGQLLEVVDLKWSLQVNLILPISSFQWLPVALRVKTEALNLVCLIWPLAATLALFWTFLLLCARVTLAIYKHHKQGHPPAPSGPLCLKLSLPGVLFQPFITSLTNSCSSGLNSENHFLREYTLLTSTGSPLCDIHYFLFKNSL